MVVSPPPFFGHVRTIAVVLVLMSSKTDLVTFSFCLIILFLILSYLEIRAERRQKSISVELSFAKGFAFKHPVSADFKHPVSAAYVIVLLTTALYIYGSLFCGSHHSHTKRRLTLL